MATKRTSRVVLRNCRLIMTSTLFEQAGDFVSAKVNEGENLMLDRYARRHILSKGHITVTYPGTDQPGTPGNAGTVFPKQDYQLVDQTFVLTADEPDTVYYCIIPGFSTGMVTVKETLLSAGDSYTVDALKVAFVFGNNYIVNGTAKTSSDVFACENNPAGITAVEDCKIAEFWAV